MGGRSVLFDLAAAALICAIGLINIWLRAGPLAEISAKLGLPVIFSPTLGVIAVIGMTLPLALRRLFPVSTLAIVTAFYAVLGLGRIPEGIASSIALLVVLYTVGAYAPRFAAVSRAVQLGVVAAITGFALYQADYSTVPGLDPGELALFALVDRATAVIISVIAFAIAWILGDTVRRSRQRQAELAKRTTELAAANATIARQAVADERLRIARDLHDVVAHHVSVMGLQAGAARRVLDRDREAAVRSLHIVEETSRRAVDELQRLLGMLRGGARDDGSPQPTMRDLVGLVERMRDAGLDVRVRTTGAQPPMPAGVQLSLYRVVQEALTNALKHAGNTARVDIDLEYSQDQLKVAVRSRSALGGQSAAAGAEDAPTLKTGRGLIGMRERVSMHGGQLRAHALDDGGFEVLATIPV